MESSRLKSFPKTENFNPCAIASYRPKIGTPGRYFQCKTFYISSKMDCFIKIILFFKYLS